MNQITKLKHAKHISKEQQKDIVGGVPPLIFKRRCNPNLNCCYHNGTTWVQGPPCF